MQNIAAPDSERLLICVKCQSVAEPSSAEYWHIGETMMRLARLRPRNSIGANRALILGFPGDGEREEFGRTLEAAARSTKRQAAAMAMRRRRSLGSERTCGRAHSSWKASN